MVRHHAAFRHGRVFAAVPELVDDLPTSFHSVCLRHRLTHVSTGDEVVDRTVGDGQDDACCEREDDRQEDGGVHGGW